MFHLVFIPLLTIPILLNIFLFLVLDFLNYLIRFLWSHHYFHHKCLERSLNKNLYYGPICQKNLSVSTFFLNSFFQELSCFLYTIVIHYFRNPLYLALELDFLFPGPCDFIFIDLLNYFEWNVFSKFPKK